MAKVVIVQPYIPAYRVPLFVELAKRLASRGHRLVIAAGEPDRTQLQRGDATHVSGVEEATLRTRSLHAGPLRVRFSSAAQVWKSADAVIVELSASSLDSYRALASRGIRVGVWGHVGAYVKEDSWLVAMLKRWQVRHADHVLAYTDGGATTAVQLGADPSNVTALNNTVDVRGLRRAVERQRTMPEANARVSLGVGSGPVFAMIGGLDESKRIDLVVAALDHLWQTSSNVQLVVGGHGELEDLFAPARLRGQVKMLGYVDDERKATIARVATALLNPGRVGLIAVESMALGLPIVTTSGTRHAPEYEYLVPGVSAVEVPPIASELATTMQRMTQDSEQMDGLRRALSARASSFSIEAMAAAMDEAIEDLLTGDKARRQQRS